MTSATVPMMPSAPRPRIASLDIIRGVVMILMAVDHVRVFSGVPAGSPDPAVFMTRWITNFVAPAFVFLAGTGAYLYGRRINDRAALAKFLAVRGAWLIFLELTFLRFAWTFNFDYSHYMLAGVIWMLGWCMILLAALIWLPMWAIAAFGLIMIGGHNLIDLSSAGIFGRNAGASALGPILQLLYYGGQVGTLSVLYVIVPWIGVMAAGYAFGQVMEWPEDRRDAFCFKTGAAAILLFVVLRYLDVYGDPRSWADLPGWHGTPAVLRFIGTSKYPASLLFLLMTLGPMFLAIPLLADAHGTVSRMLATIGRVPLFFYLLHIPVIHLLALAVSYGRSGAVSPWLFGNHPMDPPPLPDGYMWSLPLLYAVTALAIVLLYPLCAWFARLKNERQDAWLTYL